MSLNSLQSLQDRGFSYFDAVATHLRIATFNLRMYICTVERQIICPLLIHNVADFL